MKSTDDPAVQNSCQEKISRFGKTLTIAEVFQLMRYKNHLNSL